MLHKRYTTNPAVVCSQGLEGTVLLNPDGYATVLLNPIGELIWQALAQPLTVEQIVDHLQRNCDEVPAAQVAADVVAFLQALLPGRFVAEVGAASEGP